MLKNVWVTSIWSPWILMMLRWSTIMTWTLFPLDDVEVAWCLVTLSLLTTTSFFHFLIYFSHLLCSLFFSSFHVTTSPLSWWCWWGGVLATPTNLRDPKRYISFLECETISKIDHVKTQIYLEYFRIFWI